MEPLIIHLDWDGPYTLAQLESKELNDEKNDYGIYQIYGGHPTYGSNILLYIGKASQQTFYTRILQEGWEDNRDSEKLEIYVGRLSGMGTPKDKVWCTEITLAESLLIYAHKPAYNSQSIKSARDSRLENLHILNWYAHRDLMAEVSGLRWRGRDEFNDCVPYEYNDRGSG